MKQSCIDKQHRYRLGHTLASLIDSLGTYCAHDTELYGRPTGEDGFIGDAVGETLRGIRALLNGERGTFDGGTLDRRIMDIAKRYKLDLD